MGKVSDLDLLDELIAKCEAKMASGFKKKQEPKEGLPMSEEKSDEASEEEPSAEVMVAVEKPESSELSEEDYQALLEIREKLEG